TSTTTALTRCQRHPSLAKAGGPSRDEQRVRGRVRGVEDGGDSDFASFLRGPRESGRCAERVAPTCGPDLFVVMEGKHEVGPSLPAQHPVRAAPVTLDRPTYPQQGGQNATGLKGQRVTPRRT